MGTVHDAPPPHPQGQSPFPARGAALREPQGKQAAAPTPRTRKDEAGKWGQSTTPPRRTPRDSPHFPRGAQPFENRRVNTQPPLPRGQGRMRPENGDSPRRPPTAPPGTVPISRQGRSPS